MAKKGTVQKMRNSRALMGRNEEIWEMYLEGLHSQREIAAQFGISQQRVSDILSEWARGVEETPREERRAHRRAQIEGQISYCVAQRDAATNAEVRVKWSKELRSWLEFLARAEGDLAPNALAIAAQQTNVKYIIEDDDAEAMK